MKKGIILLVILLLGLGCISEEAESPKEETKVLNISSIVEHLEEYEGKDVEVIGRSRGDPVLIGGTAYADIEDGTGRIIIIFNPKKFLQMVDVRNGDEIRVKGVFKRGKASGEDMEKTMAYIGVPYFIEPTEIQFLSYG